MTTEADRLIAALNLAPHPEGGWYRETHRDAAPDGGRAASTAILFLLKAHEVSRWHRVDATEIWHWHRGAALELSIVTEDGSRQTLRLGAEIESGEAPHGIVPPYAWQMARPLGDYVLVGCTVAPGFEFAGFELAEPGWEP
ncbi:MAG: cupin domain-containing protein [Caulobacteraceae bacterium]|nr:cupin domain-containing protein [Caulobacteraceae bacterium]